MHVRLGDYVRTHQHLLLGPDYFRSALALAPAHDRIVVFSDDKTEAQKLLTGSGKDFQDALYLSGEDFTPAETMSLMSSSDCLATSASTFSGVAAMALKGTVIAPQRLADQFARGIDLPWKLIPDSQKDDQS